MPLVTLIATAPPMPQWHGRPRDVLAYIEDFLRWQDGAIADSMVEVDGVWYMPAWLFDDDVSA